MKSKIAFATTLLALSCMAANQAVPPDSIVAPANIIVRNPTTKICVDFGDVSHISPWQIKRRHPRTGGEKGGQLVTVRDALLALNKLIATDVEMPENTFTFDADGRLVSICDVQLGDGHAGKAAGMRFVGHEEAIFLQPLDGDMLEKPVRDFSLIACVLSDMVPSAPEAAAKVQPSAQPKSADAKEAHPARKSGDVKFITLPGGEKMEMIWCEPGSFMMGSPKDEEGRFEDEHMHRVTLTKGFWLGKYEVTQAQWNSVMGRGRPRFTGKDKPMDNISWDDCQSFLRAVNATLGGSARFPTEAEWEYACRAGSSAPISGSGRLDQMAWYDANSDNSTHKVGEKTPNAWGFCDMHGNVLEWCSDWFADSEGHAVDPKGPSAGSFRLLRGGCWFFLERDCRSAYRLKRDPGIRNSIFGFRMACSEEN